MLLARCFLLVAVSVVAVVAIDVEVEAADQPLMLTPYILAGEIAKAQKLSSVESFIPDKEIVSHSGFITVNQTTNASLFFWYFSTQREDAPLIIWLQGGPGASSLFGVFVEHGPYIVNVDATVSYRDVLPWTYYYNVVYIDNPVGTGFSFVGNESDYRTDEDGVAEHLFIFLDQFLQLFPDIAKNDIYVAGESMAGKFVPSFGHRLFKEMTSNNSPINFKGIVVGNGFSDPETMIPVIGEHLYSIGLLDYPQLIEFREQADLCVQYIHNESWSQAYEIFNMLIDHGVLWPYPSFYENSTGCSVYFDFVHMCHHLPPAFSDYADFVHKSDTKKKLHAGKLAFHSHSNTVKRYLVDDVPKTVRPLVEEMLNSNHTRVKVLYYNGMNDLIFPAHATDTVMRKLAWYGAAGFQNATRVVWQRRNNSEVHVNGYVKQFDKLTFVELRNGSHAVPYDVPLASFDMIFRFIEDKPFTMMTSLDYSV